MPIVIAVTGVDLLGFVAGIGLPLIFGLIARNVLKYTNEQAGAKLCRLRDLPWCVASILSIPLIGKAYYAIGFDEPSEMVILLIAALV